MVEASRQDGFQFSLPGQEFQAAALTPVIDPEKALQRKRGLLIRILRTKKDGELYRDIERIEANFKKDGTRETMYFYSTQKGRKEVLATPEDLRWVLATRRIAAAAR